MIWAILSDVHGNLEALQAVAEDWQKEGVQQIIFLGDAVGYGANPNECLSLLGGDPLCKLREITTTGLSV